MSDGNWYYAVGGQQVGPLPRADIQAAAQVGKLSPGDLVWTEGMADWIPAGSVPDFFPPSPAAGPSQPVGMMNYYTPDRGPVYASFWIRFCAAFLDGIIVNVGGLIVGGIVGAIVGGLMGVNGRTMDEIEFASGLVGQLLGYVVAWLYEAMMTSSSKQATLGKLAVGIKVTDMTGSRISFGRATGRHFAKILSGLLLLIGYLMQPFTQRKQALHDLMAGTLVVKKTTV